jgi:hypothetical protein
MLNGCTSRMTSSVTCRPIILRLVFSSNKKARNAGFFIAAIEAAYLSAANIVSLIASTSPIPLISTYFGASSDSLLA